MIGENGLIFQGWSGLLGLPVAAGLVLSVIGAVRVLGNRAGRDERAGDPGGPPARRTMGAARQSLDERYARGELTAEEYQDRLNAPGETNGRIRRRPPR